MLGMQIIKIIYYYDNSDYYQRCWGCRWAPGKSCWKQLRREGDNFVKRLQQSSRTFLSLRTFSSSLWYSSLKSFTITWILECSNRLLEEKVYYIMVISAHSTNWHVFLMWQNWHLCKSHFPHKVLILMFSILSDFFRRVFSANYICHIISKCPVCFTALIICFSLLTVVVLLNICVKYLLNFCLKYLLLFCSIFLENTFCFSPGEPWRSQRKRSVTVVCKSKDN